MTPAAIRYLLEVYLAELREQQVVSAVGAGPDQAIDHNGAEAREYARWMCEHHLQKLAQVKQWSEVCDQTECLLALGFVHGCLWVGGSFSLNDLVEGIVYMRATCRHGKSHNE